MKGGWIKTCTRLCLHCIVEKQRMVVGNNYFQK